MKYEDSLRVYCNFADRTVSQEIAGLIKRER
ncbi:Uncharacterised protein [Vibrio cholerae]|nr:Uncharacterised protein [Vibrio cholerae]CSI37889.1 Uncharacterised protein [Vibrio cholerae]